MRIAYMLTSLGIGGAEKQVIALAERMAARGHAVVLIVLRGRQPEQWPTKLETVHLDMRKSPVSVARGILRARRTLRRFRPDLVHSHTYPANMVARSLRLMGVAPAVVSTIHNVYEGGWWRMLAYRLTDSLTRRTTAVSGAAAERFVELKAIPRNKCTVVPNAIDTAEFGKDAERRARMRGELRASEDFVWLAAGRITAAKDYPNLLRAFGRVRAAHANTQLWIAGEDAGVLASLQALAKRLGVTDGIRWLGLRRDMPALLDAADGFVLSSAWEGMPLVVGEAMAMEKPVVATDVGGVRELVGEAGALVPAKSPEHLAEAMLKLMQTSPEGRQASGRAARQRIDQHFGMAARANEWESMYRSLLARRSGEHEARKVAW